MSTATAAPSSNLSHHPPEHSTQHNLLVRNVALDSLRESKTNPRKARSKEADAELVKSVRESGVLVPILARPFGNDGLYELVAGSRRLRAAQEAGLTQIPTRIMQLSDEQALEIQIVENLQREDVQPIDEGRGYRELIAIMAKAQPKRGADGQGVRRQDLIEQIAKRVGKSIRYVYARMKLADLPAELIQAMENKAISASHADLLVMLQPAQQKEAHKFLSRGVARGGDVPSVRDLKEWIESEVQHDLAAAPWNKDDNALLPVAGKATTVCANHACDKHWKNNSHGTGYRARGAGGQDPERKRQLAKEKLRRLEMEARREALRRIVGKPGATFNDDDLRAIALDSFHRLGHDRQNPLFKSLGWEPNKTHYGADSFDPVVKKKIAEMNGGQIHAFLMACAASDDLYVPSYQSGIPALKYLGVLCKRHKVNVADIRDELKAAKEKKNTAKKPVQASAKKTAAAPKGKKKGGRK